MSGIDGLDRLGPPAADLASTSVAWGDRWFDDDAALLWNPDGAFEEQPVGRSFHLVPQSAWYALGLLLRGGDGRLTRDDRRRGDHRDTETHQ